MDDNTKQGIEKLFKDALRSLAIDPEEQVRVTEPADVPFELVDEYLTWSESFTRHFKDELEAGTAQVIAALGEDLANLPGAAYGESNLVSMQQPAWQPIRERAKQVLVLLGWPCVPPAPFVRSGAGTYRRP